MGMGSQPAVVRIPSSTSKLAALGFAGLRRGLHSLTGVFERVFFMIDMSPGVYISRVQDAVDFWTFGVGLVKAPFMASVIALVGCRAGLAVTGSAESVGAMTTSSVVRSIFLVIILDALFAMFFTAVGI